MSEADVLSPCVQICLMDDESGLCSGCCRTLDEIACWTLYAREEKLAVLARVAARRANRPDPGT